MRAYALTCCLMMTGGGAMADGHDDALARLEVSTVAMTENLLNFYESRVPELAEVRPDMTWDDAFRTAGQCVLDGLTSHGGDASVATYVSAVETFAAVEIDNFLDMTQKLPEALSDPKVLEFSATCGMLELSTARMEASGLNAAFQAEGVMDRVLAPAE